jgi:hypothetical protein
MRRLLSELTWIWMDIHDTVDTLSCPPPFGILMTDIPGKFIFRFDYSK